MASQQTIACRNILDRAQRALKSSCVTFPEIMINNILDEAQELVNDHGYCWDVALAKAVRIYNATKYSANWAYTAE